MLVGDGIPTNEAAAKLLLACIAQKALAPGTRYLLMVVKCATHQAALSAKSAVEGRAASVAGGELWKSISGVSVRLYKYVINDQHWVVNEDEPKKVDGEGNVNNYCGGEL